MCVRLYELQIDVELVDEAERFDVDRSTETTYYRTRDVCCLARRHNDYPKYGIAVMSEVLTTCQSYKHIESKLAELLNQN